MRVLFIGGTGLISSACADRVVAAGHELWMLTRGSSPLAAPPGAHLRTADARDPEAVDLALAGLEFDVVVQWIAFTPDQVEADVARWRGHTGQYVFISSASAYEKPPSHWLVTEGTPLVNPFWEYSRAKIACETVLAGAGDFPWTVVRPSLTYGPSQIPVAVGSWSKPFTVVDRLRRGRPLLIPGDGTSLWTVTHNSDFAAGLAGLLGRSEAISEAFHITSDEALTWNQIYQAVADAAGVELRALHVPTDLLVAADEQFLGTLWGDKAHSAVFDNTKLRSLVPDFRAEVPFAQGIAETVAWFDAEPARRLVDSEADALWDRVAAVYEAAASQLRAGR